MSGRPLRSSFLVLLLIAATLVAETVLLPSLTIYQIKPSLIIVVIVFAALGWGWVAGVTLGLGLGLLQDVLSGGVMGTHLLSKGLIGLFSAELRRWFDPINTITQLTFVVAATLLDGFLYGLIALAFLPQIAFTATILYRLFPLAAYNALLGLVIAVALKKIWRPSLPKGLY